jgi:hypothetical protein
MSDNDFEWRQYKIDKEMTEDLQMLSIIDQVMDQFMPNLNATATAAALAYMKSKIDSHLDHIGARSP